jgi:hypothetical protein
MIGRGEHIFPELPYQERIAVGDIDDFYGSSEHRTILLNIFHF